MRSFSFLLVFLLPFSAFGAESAAEILEKANTLRSAGAYDQAVLRYEEALARTAAEGDAATALRQAIASEMARCLRVQGEAEPAADLLLGAGLPGQAAAIYRDEGQLERALTLYRAADNAAGVAFCLERLDRLDEAATIYREEGLHRALGRVLERQGLVSDALVAYEKAGNRLAQARLLRLLDKEPERATRLLEEWIDEQTMAIRDLLARRNKRPDDVRVIQSLAASYETLGKALEEAERPDRALKAYDLAYKFLLRYRELQERTKFGRDWNRLSNLKDRIETVEYNRDKMKQAVEKQKD